MSHNPETCVRHGECIQARRRAMPTTLPLAAHWSDCATHNEPALPAGPCDCRGLPVTGPAVPSDEELRDRELAGCEPHARQPDQCWTHDAPMETCPALVRIQNARRRAHEDSAMGVAARWFLLAVNSHQVEVWAQADDDLELLLDGLGDDL